jgi:hypothetical protein
VLNDVEVVRVENFQKGYSDIFDYGNGYPPQEMAN